MKPSYEELEEQLNRSRRLCDAALANERVWETTMMEACGEDGPASVAAEIKALRAQRDTAMESLRQQLSALAAELSAVKDAVIARIKLHEEIRKAGRPPHTDFWHQSIYMADKKVDDALNLTPNHDAFLAEVRAQGRNEGINYAASRLAAAYNHGFIGKSMSEVADVVHMILDTKEELENSTLPAADGLSGEYAEAFLEDSAAQLRKGVQS
ncbi:hypothetical protein [Enterobacter hormaechei]|uniref:hypothetical protein n=1 Tax=Enterobacter hormaechei TaxID=158836 RepID=UPI003524D5A7